MRWGVAIACLVLAAGCAGPTLEEGGEMELTSPAMEEGGTIPQRFSCEGRDVSPPLNWSGVPQEAKSLVLVMDDPDAPGGTFTHWVAYGIPPGKTGLAAGEPALVEGMNDFGDQGYGGPCPPAGTTHTYRFRLYALDTEPDLKPGASKEEVLEATESHVLAQAEFKAEFGR